MPIDETNYPLSVVSFVLQERGYQPVKKGKYRIMIPILNTDMMLSVAYLPNIGKCFKTSVYKNDVIQYFESAKIFAKKGLDLDVFRIEEEIKRLQCMLPQIVEEQSVEELNAKILSVDDLDIEAEHDFKSILEELEHSVVSSR